MPTIRKARALFTVTIDEDKRLQAVADIRTLIGDENAMTGSAVSTAIATTSTVSRSQRSPPSWCCLFWWYC